MTKYVNPFAQHEDLNGAPTAGFTVFFGQPNLDPKLNTKAPFSDAALTIPLPPTKVLDQTGGYGIDYFLDGAYSIRIEDTLGALYRETPSFSGIPSASETNVPIQDEGIDVVVSPLKVNYIGPGVTVANNLDIADVTIPGLAATTINVVTFTANDTHIPTAGTFKLQIIAQAGSGAGGGCNGQGASTAGSGGAGSGGGTVFLTTSTIDASYAIVIGLGGVPGAIGDFPGGDGGDTTVISTSVTITADGGLGGSGDTATSGDNTNDGPNGQGGTGGDWIHQGGDGSGRIVITGDNATASTGGGTYFNSGVSQNTDGTGRNGIESGGTGGRCGNATTDFAGGSGSLGKVIIIETIL